MRKERYARLSEDEKREHSKKSAQWVKDNRVLVSQRANADYQLNKEKYRESYRAYYARNKDIFKAKRKAKAAKVKAQRAVNIALKTGSLTREPCQICKKSTVEAHHNSYIEGQELNVTWLCRSHHKAWHRLFAAEE